MREKDWFIEKMKPKMSSFQFELVSGNNEFGALDGIRFDSNQIGGYIYEYSNKEVGLHLYDYRNDEEIISEIIISYDDSSKLNNIKGILEKELLLVINADK